MSKMRTQKTKIYERIESLEKESDALIKSIEGDLSETKKKASDLGKLLLGIGGGLLLTTLVIRGLTGKKKSVGKYRSSNRRVYHRMKDQLFGELSAQALAFALSVLRDRVKSQKEGIDNNEENDLTSPSGE